MDNQIDGGISLMLEIIPRYDLEDEESKEDCTIALIDIATNISSSYTVFMQYLNTINSLYDNIFTFEEEQMHPIRNVLNNLPAEPQIMMDNLPAARPIHRLQQLSNFIFNIEQFYNTGDLDDEEDDVDVDMNKFIDNFAENLDLITSNLSHLRRLQECVPVEKRLCDSYEMILCDLKKQVLKLKMTRDEWVTEWCDKIQVYDCEDDCITCTGHAPLVSFKCCGARSMCPSCVLKFYYESTKHLFKSFTNCPLCKAELTFADITKV